MILRITDDNRAIPVRSVKAVGSYWIWVQSNYTLPVSEWVHLVVTYSRSSGQFVMYINGQQVATSTNATTNVYGQISNCISFGARYDITERSYSHIMLDNLRIFNRILTADEVSYIYNLESSL